MRRSAQGIARNILPTPRAGLRTVILLFAFRKYDVFPVDTWIRKVYSDIVGGDATNAQMRKKLCEMYGKYAGIAQQYLFFYKRETSGR